MLLTQVHILFSFLKLYDFVFDKITAINNYIILDITIGIFCVVMSFIYIFHLCALLPVFINAIFRLYKLFYKVIPAKEILKTIFSVLIEKKLTKVNYNLLVYRITPLIMKHNKMSKILGIILFPIGFVIDIILMYFKICIAVFLSGIGDVCILIRLILNSLRHLRTRIYKISDRHIVAMSFRLATIIFLVAIQIENSYFPIFRKAEASTAVFEFVASAIIIPLIFEWIYSYRNRT